MFRLPLLLYFVFFCIFLHLFCFLFGFFLFFLHFFLLFFCFWICFLFLLLFCFTFFHIFCGTKNIPWFYRIWLEAVTINLQYNFCYGNLKCSRHKPLNLSTSFYSPGLAVLTLFRCCLQHLSLAFARCASGFVDSIFEYIYLNILASI